MNIYYIKCLMFTKNNKIKVNHEIVEKNSIVSRCLDSGFKMFAAIDKEELSDLLKDLI